MKKIIICSVLAAALFSSCGTMKKYQRPDNIFTDNLYGDVQTSDTTTLASLSWREMFTDPTLQALIEEGLKNTTMQTAELQIDEMEYALRAAKLAFIPSITLGAEGKLSGVLNYDAASTSKTYTVPLTAAWQLGSIVSLRNAKMKAKMQLQLMRDARQAAQAGIVCGIVQMYYTLAMMDAQLALSTQTAENWKRTVEINKALMEAGQATEATVAQSEATYITIQTQLVELRSSIKQLENKFSALLGRTPGPITRNSLDTWQTPASVSVGYPLQLLSRRPDVRVAEMNLAAAFYSVAEAKSAFYPSLTLSGTLGFTNAYTQPVPDAGKFIWNALGSLMQPIFANGRLRANLRIQKDEMEIARLKYQQTLVDAGAEVNSAMDEIVTADEKAALYAAQVEALKRALKSTELLMSNSSYNYLAVLTAQTSLLSAQMNELNNRYNCIQSTTKLYQALGGGAD